MGQTEDTRANRRSELSYPWGAPDTQEPAYAATIEATLLNNMTFINPAQLTGDVTINAVFESELQAGSRVVIRLEADGTNRTFTPGTGFLEQTPIVVALSTTRVVTYVYNGTGLEFISNELSS